MPLAPLWLRAVRIAARGGAMAVSSQVSIQLMLSSSRSGVGPRHQPAACREVAGVHQIDDGRDRAGRIRPGPTGALCHWLVRRIAARYIASEATRTPCLTGEPDLGGPRSELGTAAGDRADHNACLSGRTPRGGVRVAKDAAEGRVVRPAIAVELRTGDVGRVGRGRQDLPLGDD